MKSTVNALASSFTLALVLGSVLACAKPAATPGEGPPAAASDSSGESESSFASSSESAKTRELEEKATAYQERFQDIQASDMSAEQKAQAASELVDEQQRTVREAQDGSAEGAPADSQ